MHETEPGLLLIAQLPEPHYSTFSQFLGLSVKICHISPPTPKKIVMLDIQIKPLLLDIITKYLK